MKRSGGGRKLRERSRKIGQNKENGLSFYIVFLFVLFKKSLFHKSGLLSGDSCVTEPIYMKDKTAFLFPLSTEIVKK